MLATLADQGDQRPCWLVPGNRHEDQVTGVRQLAKLAGRLDLRVVHVISRPAAAWAGERSRIDAALLDRVLPEHRRTLQYFICAREDMVRSVEEDLTGLGIPRDRVHGDSSGWCDGAIDDGGRDGGADQLPHVADLRGLGPAPGLTGEPTARLSRAGR